jgi:predicted PurR-regulated permease PerM
MTPEVDQQELLAKRMNQICWPLQSLLFLAIIGSMYLARDFLLPVVLALFVALTLRPAVRFLQRWHVPPWLAATIFVVLIVTTAFLFGYILQMPIAAWIDQAPQLQQKFTSKFAGITDLFARFSNLTDQIQNAAAPAAGQPVQEVVVRQHALPGIMVSLTGYPIQFGVTLAATLVIAVFLLASGDMFYEKLVRTLPNLSARKQALHIVYAIEDEVSTYVLTLTAVNAVLGLLIATTFGALGMPSPYLWGLLIFVVNFVPYIGTISGVVLASFMAVVTFDSVSYALLVPLSYTAWSLLESEIVRPLILGRRFQMNAVAILLSIAFWSWLWGIAGAAIAVPALITLKIFCEHMDGLTGLGEFLSSRRPDIIDEVAPIEASIVESLTKV